jgi:arsenate reductase
MTVTIYHSPDCHTSRNVRRLVRNTSEEPRRTVEYLKHPPTRDEPKALIARMHIPVRDVLRQKGTPFDALGLGDPKLSDDQLRTQ